MRWTLEEMNQLKTLVLSKKYTYPEIAQMMRKSRSQCQQKAEYQGLKNPVYMNRKKKHIHLRKQLLLYYQDHSAEEVQKKFNLTKSEFKSCLCAAYTDPKLNHIRKETRRHDAWCIKEIRFLLQHAGLKPRKWISRKLNRGGVYAVKESLERLKIRSKHFHGMPKAWIKILFPEALLEFIQTQAGPSGQNGIFHFKLIPWIQIETLLKGKKINPDIRLSIQALAKFQRWLFGTTDVRKITKLIQQNIEV